MPCIGFKCPDSDIGNITFKDCLKTCPGRCISRRTAQLFEKFSKDRGLDEYSITQLMMPTRQLYLMLTCPYYERPESFIARSIGILGHEMTDIDIDNGLSEKRLKLKIGDITVSGKFDSFENEEELWDLKITGSYKIMLGLKNITTLHQWILQQNFYRLLVERNLSAKVKHMYIEAWAKEPPGHLKKYGCPQRVTFDLPKLSDWAVEKYVLLKHDLIKEALSKGWCSKCKARETWNGRRCSGYCPVKKDCKEMDVSLQGE